MKKKLIWLLGIMIFLMPFIIVQADTQNGWKHENGKTYYYESGEMVHGFKEINGKTYFFGITKGALLTGWQELPEGRFYLYEDGTVRQGWQEIDGKIYYVENNYITRGFEEIEGKTYFFGITKGALLTGWQELPEGRFYLYEDGTVRQGWQEIDGKIYYVENNYITRGFKEIDGKTYFFGITKGALLTGWQELPEGKFYLYKDGTVRQGWQGIDGKTYYVKDNYIVRGTLEIDGTPYEFNKETGILVSGLYIVDNNQVFIIDKNGSRLYGWQEVEGKKYYIAEDGYAVHGFKEIEGKTYFFGITKGALLTGWQELPEGKFYLYKDGTVRQGWQEIDGKTYYVEDNYIVRGFKEIDGKTYFFGITKGALLTGWQELSGERFYLYDDGSVKQGWQKIEGKVYYVEDNYIVRGFKEIEGKTYFFGITKGALLTGFQTLDGKTFYLNNDGTLFQESGFQTINNKKYYFENNYVIKGSKEIEGKTYYFDTKTGELKTGVYKQNGNEYYYDNYGKLTKIQYIPKYYSQRDSRWSNTYYGSGNMKNSGCAPTSMAMAFSSILERTILPVDVAYYLYHKTTEFNKPTLGASGRAVQLAASHFGVKWKGLASTTEIANALSNGKIVFANVGPGKFTSPGLTHAIVLYKNENGNTLAMDPYNSGNNGKISISTVWAQRSKNSYDLRGGYAFYALG